MNNSTNGANMIVLDRVFVLLVTEGDKMPFEQDWKGDFVVSVPSDQPGQPASLGLAPVQSIMQVPNNAALCANPNEGILMLQKVKAELKPEMSGKSGLQACVVHTEALFDMSTGNLAPNLMLFPVGFMPYDEMVKSPTPEQAAQAAVMDDNKEVDGTPDTSKAEKDVPEPPRADVEGTPADNPSPAMTTMKVVMDEKKAE